MIALSATPALLAHLNRPLDPALLAVLDARPLPVESPRYPAPQPRV